MKSEYKIINMIKWNMYINKYITNITERERNSTINTLYWVLGRDKWKNPIKLTEEDISKFKYKEKYDFS